MISVVGGQQWVPLSTLIKNKAKEPPEPELFEVRVGERIVGPVTLDQVRRGIEAGKVPPHATVRRVGADGWSPPNELVQSSHNTEAALPSPPPSFGIQAPWQSQGRPLRRVDRRWFVIAGSGAAAVVVLVVGTVVVGLQYLPQVAPSASASASASSSTPPEVIAARPTTTPGAHMGSTTSPPPPPPGLCADLEPWVAEVKADAKALDGLGEEYGKRNRVAKTGQALFENMLWLAKTGTERAQAIRSRRDKLKQHHLLAGEAAVLEKVTATYEVNAKGNEMIGTAAGKDDNVSGLAKALLVVQALDPETKAKKWTEEIRVKCSKLNSAASPSASSATVSMKPRGLPSCDVVCPKQCADSQNAAERQECEGVCRSHAVISGCRQ
ncbi:MAG: DUF4339 domain-containing protein [Polyangiaceae bacterium]|nr:DUF4339 domain-containing protein [Polyangiaceae bacterium]